MNYPVLLALVGAVAHEGDGVVGLAALGLSGVDAPALVPLQRLGGAQGDVGGTVGGDLVHDLPHGLLDAASAAFVDGLGGARFHSVLEALVAGRGTLGNAGCLEVVLVAPEWREGVLLHRAVHRIGVATIAA